MRSRNPIKSVAQFMEHQYDVALLRLKQALDLHQQEQQKLTMLEDYHREYRDKLLGQSIPIHQLKQIQTFLDNLHVSVFEQTKKVTRLKEECKTHQQAVRHFMQKKKGLEVIIEKREALDKQAALKRESEEIQEIMLNSWIKGSS